MRRMKHVQGGMLAPGFVGESMTAVEKPFNSVPRFSWNSRAAALSRLENDWQQGIDESTGATRRHKAA